MKFADRLKFNATGASAALLTAGTAIAGCRTLAQAIADGALAVNDSKVPFTVTDGTAWEDSLYTITSATQLTRTQVLASSAGGTTPATFSAALTAYNTVPGSVMSRVSVDSDVAFSQSIPLTQPGTAWMPPQTVSGALAFTPAANAVKGAFAYVRLVADNTNTPTFPGFTEEIGSAGYDNRKDIVNRIQFSYDGADYWFAVSQALSAAPTASALTLSLSTTTAVSGSAVTVTVGTNSALTGAQSETVTLTAPMAGTWSTNPVTLNAAALTAAPTFTPSATGSGSISATASGTPTLSGASAAFTATAAPVAPGAPTIGTATTGDATASVTFTAPASNGGAAITGYTVTAYKASDNSAITTASGSTSPINVTGLTNGIGCYFKVAATNSAGTGSQSAASNTITPVAGTYPRLTNLARMTESGTGPYLYAANGATTYGGGEGDGSLQLNAGDGQLIIKLNTAPSSNANEVMLALDDSSAAQQYSTMSYAVVSHATGYTPFTGSGTPGTPTNSVSASANDYVRMKRTGSALTCDVSSNNGGTWTTVMSWAGVPTGVMYFHCLPIGTFTFSLLSSVGTP